ncbi:hypothetical protein [Paraburkholderia dipogonis]|uniref:hypothetical protein n=1 Tax=Paraburkholderia dipogonis TaxID=1211383 RepID=UPI0038B7D3FD
MSRALSIDHDNARLRVHFSQRMGCRQTRETPADHQPIRSMSSSQDCSNGRDTSLGNPAAYIFDQNNSPTSTRAILVRRKHEKLASLPDNTCAFVQLYGELKAATIVINSSKH